MILKIHIQSLLDPFQGLRFYSRWKLHENAKQIYPIQFLRNRIDEFPYFS